MDFSNQHSDSFRKTFLQKGTLRLYLFNVGQGDHILIKLPDNRYGIVDFYYNNNYFCHSPSRYYFENLKRIIPEETIEIAFVCLSHPDADHLTGIDSFIEWVVENQVTIPQFWLFGSGTQPLDITDVFIEKMTEANNRLPDIGKVEFKNRKDAYFSRLRSVRKLGELADQSGVKSVVDIKNLPDLGGSYEAFSMGPRKIDVDNFLKKDFKSTLHKSLLDDRYRGSSEKNDVSTMLLLQFDKYKLFFAGDSSSKMLAKSIKDYDDNYTHAKIPDFDSHFVKGIHHGSHHSSSMDIWKRLISSSFDNKVQIGISAGTKYQHPHWITLHDILEACMQNGNLVELNSTNMDIKRISRKNYLVEDINWMFEDFQEDFSDPLEVENSDFNSMAIGHYRHSGYQVKNDDLLGAFIYDFDPNKSSSEIAVTIGKYNRSQ